MTWMNVFLLMYMEKGVETQETSSVFGKDGEMSVSGGLLCFCLVLFYIFTFFNWAFFIIIEKKTFSTNIH